jgi:hypothetical protein
MLIVGLEKTVMSPLRVIGRLGDTDQDELSQVLDRLSEMFAP